MASVHLHSSGRSGWPAEPLARQVARDIEWATLLIALERGAGVHRQTPGVGEIDPNATTPRTQIGMDLVDGRAVQPQRLYGRIVDAGETDQRHADDCATVAKDYAATS